MSDFTKDLLLEKVRQALIETMAAFLDDGSTRIDEQLADTKDPVKRDESELHIRMAYAAFHEYAMTMDSDYLDRKFAEQ
jgi:hypothetical protein